MPSNPQPKTDHVEEARAILKAASEEPVEEVRPVAIQEAQAHASIAIAEELRGLREALSGKAEGRYRRALTEIAALAEDEGQQDDNRVRARTWKIADRALGGANR